MAHFADDTNDSLIRLRWRFGHGASGVARRVESLPLDRDLVVRSLNKRTPCLLDGSGIAEVCGVEDQ